MGGGGRGSRPRRWFEGNKVDNEAWEGLLKLLGGGKLAKSVDDRWAIVVISKSGGTMETAVAFRQFLAALRSSHGGETDAFRSAVIPVTGKTGRLADLATDLKCPQVFEVPDGVGGRFSVFSAVGVLPAAILGINVVELLDGAIQMNEHFRTAPPEENVILNFVGVGHLLETHALGIGRGGDSHHERCRYQEPHAAQTDKRTAGAHRAGNFKIAPAPTP